VTALLRLSEARSRHQGRAAWTVALCFAMGLVVTAGAALASRVPWRQTHWSLDRRWWLHLAGEWSDLRDFHIGRSYMPYLVRYERRAIGPVRVSWPASYPGTQAEVADITAIRRREMPVGDAALLHLNPTLALAAYGRVWATPTTFDGDPAKADAGYGLARACVEAGDFKGALSWVSLRQRCFDRRCGNCADGLVDLEHVYRSVWGAAMLPPAQARVRLKCIARGMFQRRRSPLTGSESAWQTGLAVQEASLVLGEMLAKDGQAQEARPFFRKAAACKAEPASSLVRRLARAHLSRLDEKPNF
jgi:hypothetical protein